MTQHDLIVIGAGMAGLAAAEKCASRGWQVAVVDDQPYGGTCALRGCDPKKILRRAAEVVESARLMAGRGVGVRGGGPGDGGSDVEGGGDAGGLAIDWADLVAYKRGFTDPAPARMEANLTRLGIRTLHGVARFVGADALDIDGERHTAAHILVATGAVPRPLDFPGHEHVLDSTGFMELATLPERILFLGGGFVSFEFAHVAVRAGSRTVIIDRHPRPLKQFDPDLVERLVASGARAGVEVWRSSTISRIERIGTELRVTVETDGVPREVAADLVVHGAGRIPDLARLDLGAAGVAYDTHGVTVTEHLQSTTNPAVWAAGDAAASPGLPLTPVAVVEAKVAASNMLKGDRAELYATPDHTGTPAGVFSIPELVRVGLLEHEAHDAGIDVDVRLTDTSGWYSSYRIGGTTSAVKVLVDRATDRVIGAHLLGPDYAELANTFALAIKVGLTRRQLAAAPALYPTLGSDLSSML
ncbi:dihydrolipoyl dehydrogenase family protein [Raineyella antarctica]|nr:NAD(P)/FAD-dependent oxidoreductase [Raineyella antarctica]